MTFVARFRQNVAAHENDTALTMLDDRGAVAETLTYGETNRRAEAVAEFLRGHAKHQDRVLLAFSEPVAFVVALIGCGYARMIGVPVAVPASGVHDRGRIARMAAVATDAEPALALTSRKILDEIWPHVRASGLHVESYAIDDIEPSDGNYSEGSKADDLFFLQYTSGSTAMPRGVRIAHRNVVANFHGIRERLGSSTPQTTVSWLPHFHDMGLVFATYPLYFGGAAVLMAPATFLKRPLRWLEAIAAHGGSLSGVPNFALDLCVRRTDREARSSLDLSSLQTLCVGAEPVFEATLQRFTEAFAPHGFAASAIAPSYGLAEATLCVTMGRSPLGGRAVVLADGSRRVSCGKPPAGTAVRIVDVHERVEVADGSEGEIVVHGPSVSDGYWRSPLERVTLLDEAGVAQSFLATGDLGAIVGGELIVASRLKDVIIVNGASFHPTDLEVSALAAIEAASACAAFGATVDDAERLIVAVEIGAGVQVERADVLNRLRSAIADGHDVSLFDVVVVRPGRLPRTSSGKIKRHACRELFATGRLERARS